MTAPVSPTAGISATGTYAPPAPSAPTYAPPAPVPAPAPATPAAAPWPLWQRVVFRFLAVYLALQIAPWDWLRPVPGVSFVLQPYDAAVDWAVRTANATLFHVRDTLVLPNGSGDTSYAWAQLWLFLGVAAVAAVAWSLIDRKPRSHTRLAYWLRQSVRYYVASAALGYGIIKLLLLQMPFPSLSQLATPLGDLLPMRLSWLFIGYSAPYQFFSGAMETLAGLLLIYRRTTTAGVLVAAGAFANVVMINLAYDVPVKVYASHLFLCSVLLLAFDAPRLVRLLVLNQPVPATAAYDRPFHGGWKRGVAVLAKAYLVVQFLVLPAWGSWQRLQGVRAEARRPTPFAVGVYDVRRFVVGRDSVTAARDDSLRWRDVIFDTPGSGSVGTRDALFGQRYGRGYFRFRPDTAHRTVAVWKTSTVPRDSTFLFTLRYAVPDARTIRFDGVIRGDSVHVELARTARHFQLAERQFHWLSEYNR